MKYAITYTVFFLLFFNTASYAATDEVGVIIFVTGKATASNQSKTRTLKRRAKVLNGDTLTTDKNSKLQVRFIDGAIVSLREDTILKIDDYVYKSKTKKENSALSLLKGGFRTISGGIGKKHYKVTTNMATIGIRGTHYEAVYDQGNLYIATWHGGVKVHNDGGDINLGLGAAYNFAQITNIESAPAGLSNPPEVFKHQYKRPVAMGEKRPPVKQAPPPAPPSQLAQPAPPPLLPPNTDVSGTTLTTNTTNIANVNLNRLGLVTYSGASQPKFFGGKAGYDGAGNPVITDNGLGPHDPGFNTTAANVAFWKGTAATISKGSKSYGAGYTVDWGIWDTSTGTAIRQNDPEGLAFNTDVQRNLYWITLAQTPATTLASLSGSATYYTSASMGNVIGGGSGGAINNSNFSFNANTNFDTGVVSGSMSISNADGWYVAFNGDPNNSTNGKGLVKGVLDVTVDKSASFVQTTLGVKADMGMVITGANAEAVAGAFDLEAYNKSTNVAVPTIHAEGVFVAEK